MFKPIGLSRPTSRVHDEHSVVLITRPHGIGRATALAFAKEGARIALSSRRDEAQTLLAELRAKGVDAEFWRAEVRHDDDIRDLVDKAVARFDRLDVAVNNAGTEGKPGPVTEQSTESYAATSDTNVLGKLLSMKRDLRARMRAEAGRDGDASAGESAGQPMAVVRPGWHVYGIAPAEGELSSPLPVKILVHEKPPI